VDVRAWLDRARSGDQAAFGQLIDRYQRLVYRTAFAALGRREDAEDAAQEAFLQAWRHLPSFRGDAAFRTWLLTIVWRKALDRRRSRLQWWKRAATHQIEDADPFDEVPSAEPSPERITLGRDRADRVQRAIAGLSPTLRDTLLLAASGEYSYDEISAMLKTPLGTIKWRVAEARRLVAARMDA
jgi:RNA polymerase sigma-70 factor (ECF subfamily)